MTASEQTRTSPTNGAVEPTGDGHQCIFEDLTARFVVYRAHRASTRGMSFSWQTTGGFTPLTMTLGTQAPLPTSLSYLPELGYLAVIDSATVGLSLFDGSKSSKASPVSDRQPPHLNTTLGRATLPGRATRAKCWFT
jgi:hypothetical protein